MNKPMIPGTPKSVTITNDLTVTANGQPAGTPPPAGAVATNEPPPAKTVATNEPPPATAPAIAPAVAVTNAAPAAPAVTPATVAPATVTNSAGDTDPLTKMFNNAFNDGSPRRVVMNICDNNRVLPGNNLIMAVSLWSLVAKTTVTNSVQIVRQLGHIVVTKQAACAANGKTLNVASDYSMGLGNYFATVPICNRTLRRNEMSDSYIRGTMTDSADLGLDIDILGGAGADNTGLKGVIGDTGTIELEAGTSLAKALGRLSPADLANATIVIRPMDWFDMLDNSTKLDGVMVAFVNGVQEMRYLGVRVVPSLALPATHYAVVGNFGRYIAGYDKNLVVTADVSVLFAEDKTLFKVQAEACGGSNSVIKTINGAEVASFVSILAAVEEPVAP